MKYFFDTEFIEGVHKPLFGPARFFLDLVSIAIISEDGRRYQAICNEYRYDRATKFVKENVILPLWRKQPSTIQQKTNPSNFHKHKDIGKPRKQIAGEIMQFVNPRLGWPVIAYSSKDIKEGGALYDHFEKHDVRGFEIRTEKKHYANDTYYYARPEFYAYYASHDWVVLTSLFGNFDDLPPGFPRHCNCLKQRVEALAEHIIKRIPDGRPTNEGWSKGKLLMLSPELAEHPGTHDAMEDAEWNMALYKFIKQKESTLFSK